jgi:glycosyltransferase involved in cell wall biosynthesis
VDNKGVWVILQAVQQLRCEGFRDFVVEINGGNLQYASAARRAEFETFMAKENELPVGERNVIFNGSYSVQQLPQRMARVDWCIVPSVWWEIFGLVISEAWMFKRPVIASNVGGPGERITHEKDGLLFEVADPSSLAYTLRRACSEEGLWQRLVEGITPPASADTMADGYLRVYRPQPAERAA